MYMHIGKSPKGDAGHPDQRGGRRQGRPREDSPPEGVRQGRYTMTLYYMCLCYNT